MYGGDQCVGDTLCAGGIMYGQRNRSAWAPYMAPIKIIMGSGILLMMLQAIATWFKDLAKAKGEKI